MKLRLSIAVALSVLLATAAFGQATRTWVSGVGDDVNPCSRTAPCKTFAGAISKTAPGGQISVLDPGGFGTVTITKSMTIDGTGVVSSSLNAGVPAIVVNAGTGDRVVLKNLQIDGAGSGTDGVRIFQAKSVVIDGCIIENQQGAGGRGVVVQPASGVVVRLIISNSQILNTAAQGVHANPAVGGTALVILNHVLISGAGTDGVGSNLISGMHLNDVTITGSTNNGLHVDGTGFTSVDRCTFARNGADGMLVGPGASTSQVSDTFSSQNGGAGFRITGGTLASYHNNRSFDNAVADTAPGTATAY
jgi:hypothetical protein